MLHHAEDELGRSVVRWALEWGDDGGFVVLATAKGPQQEEALAALFATEYAKATGAPLAHGPHRTVP